MIGTTPMPAGSLPQVHHCAPPEYDFTDEDSLFGVINPKLGSRRKLSMMCKFWILN